VRIFFFVFEKKKFVLLECTRT